MAPFDERRITFLGRAHSRGEQRLFGIRQADRRHHMYVVGKTGTGKSTFLANMICQDIEAGEGLAVLDPHGDLVERALQAVPENRKTDLIYLCMPD